MPASSPPASSPARRRKRGAGRVVLTLACAALVAAALSGSHPTRATAGEAEPARRVILILAPYLTFDDLSPTATPALWRLAEDGAAGALNARTADSGAPSAVSGALTISASRWASVDSDAPATASDISALQDAQADSLSRPVLGLLGQAIHDAGGWTGAISLVASDSASAGLVRRPDHLVAMDTHGFLDESSTARQPLSDALRTIDPSGAPRLLVLDVPALAAASESPAEAPGRQTAHAAAVRRLDDAVAVVREQAPADATIMVISPATEKSWYEDPDLGVAIIGGPGFDGELTSSSTHRAGLVTTLDVAPTILTALGIRPPSTMVGLPMTSRPTATPLSEQFSAFAAHDAATGIVDRLREAWFIRCFVAYSLVTIAFALWVLKRGRVRRGAMLTAAALTLIATALPPAAWLMFVGGVHLGTVWSALGALGIATIAVAAGVLGVARIVTQRRGGDRAAGALAGALAVSALTTVVILVDQWTGDPLRTGLFSYSVRSGWRFYGMGNEGAALVVGASLVSVGVTVELLRQGRWRTLVRRAAIPVIGAVVLVTTAAPFAGANAGAAIWGVVAYAVAWVAVNRIRMSARAIGLTAALVALIVAGFVAIDMATASGGSTHLARFAEGIFSGDMNATIELVSRKLAHNLGYFVATPYTLLFLALGGVFALVRRGSSSQLRLALEQLPAVRGVLLGAFVGGLVALATEDSSSVMPALLWFAALMPVLLVALESSRDSS